jgi:Domain of unknown function (DUF4129)
MTTPGPVTREGAQRDAQRELSKAIYHRSSEPLPVRLVRDVGRWIDHILNRAASVSTGGSAGVIALLVLLGVVVIVVIWRVGAPRRSANVGAVLVTGRSISAADHRAMADRAADSHDWHTAVVELMRAIARELEERSVLEHRRGRTATELANEASGHLPQAASALSVAAARFNAVAYGGCDAAPADLEVMRTADRAVRDSVRSEVLAQ